MPGSEPSESTANKFRPRLPPPADESAQGLGDVIKRVTSALGFPPCDGCERRADALNRMFPFKNRRNS